MAPQGHAEQAFRNLMTLFDASRLTAAACEMTGEGKKRYQNMAWQKKSR